MSFFVERLGLIISENSQTGAGNNINGPCCIEVPLGALATSASSICTSQITPGAVSSLNCFEKVKVALSYSNISKLVD